MDLGIAGKRALVMASSTGLGLAIAEGLADEGVDVVITGRSAAALVAAADAINARSGGRAHAIVADLATAEGRAALGAAADGVDILVCNTGGPPPMRAADIAADEWRRQLDLMLVPVTEIARAALPAMRRRGWGRILTVASSGVVQPIDNLAISNALRAAVTGWSKTLATEVAADGVTVNVLLPGRIRTDRVDVVNAATARASGQSVEAVAEASQKTIPMGRYGRPDEFAAMAVFLASARASYVTGSTVRVDGGIIRSV